VVAHVSGRAGEFASDMGHGVMEGLGLGLGMNRWNITNIYITTMYE
jgi:hypothetical protein